MKLVGVFGFALLWQLTVAGPVLPVKEIKLHPDVGLNVLEMIAKYGYPIERHWVTTSDGYILELHRIPHGINNANEENKPVVLVMHGLSSSSADFINMGPEKSLGYLLADQGYDVWMGNARGSTWSRNHTTLDPDVDKEFWSSSWHEIGIIDLPTKIDYILETTGQESLYYIGHSQGTTSFYVMASQRPEYNDKIRLMVALAPVAYMSKLLNPIFLVASQIHEDIEWLANELGIYEIGPHTEGVTEIGKMFCDDGHPYQDICSNLMFIIAGFNIDQMNATMIPVILSNAPTGAATKQYFHYAQNIKSGFFRLYDYGTEENMNIYGQATPPPYDMSQVTAPIALFYSANDWLAAVEDVQQLSGELPNVALSYEVPHPKFNHFDYLFANDVVPLLYNKVLEVISLH